ncbi:NAD(P)/FAD-dependent oxidoreductase (plasmid) [Paenibacillus urinalis]|uniref:NAD(P)/FAD-dependent oxidoreductase n=1 Tax=Paenibacillus urinalis TaxID=521520 RepID=A0AAX3N6M5_9BACL|nr:MULTISPECIES: NAD(P)/FAD-dependent oxidoreductase [Paenibacillus]MCM3131042.1 NAD(P)/FAD-dependent oxidoreductase [Paenibacillus sp. MER 78]WDH85370.1 NAD(P)/FAD-dependent oxidoreductase [Paenibacillus urinalis]WDH95192.1 NAD(P)/FAD-dependent oxidoreductase [Paenibacillus urinalis]WDI05334.1 NAD(P)/FAD-dependent oxidoreductase [Paenibacillus urinalis]
MKIWDTIVIGGGQAGLASGYYLKTSGRSFLILEAGGQAAGSWPYYYDSLKLFSPAKYSSLPGLPLASPGERYPLRDEVIAYLNEYARFFELPLVFHTRVIEVLRNNTGVFEIHTSSGKRYLSRTLICATGSFNKPYVPQITGEQTYKRSITHSAFYRSPEAYKDQRVIVVGRGNSAVQISMELAEVAHATLAVREPVSLVPQRILGRDIHDWFKWFGIDSVWPIGKKLALNSSVMDLDHYRQRLKEGKPQQRPMFSAFYEEGVVWENGEKEKIDQVIFATGYRSNYEYLKRLDALNVNEEPLQKKGVSTAVEGLYYVGIPGQRSFSSATLRGVGPDARYVIDQAKKILN